MALTYLFAIDSIVNDVVVYALVQCSTLLSYMIDVSVGDAEFN